MTVAKAAEHESASSATAVAAFSVSVTFFAAAMPIDGNAAVAQVSATATYAGLCLFRRMCVICRELSEVPRRR